MQYDIELGVEERLDQLANRFQHWEKIKDVIDQLLDIMLDYRQSGHPGGSRSKVHVLVVTLLSGLMRWDIRHPEKALRGSRHSGGRPHQSGLLRYPGRPQRVAANEVQADR